MRAIIVVFIVTGCVGEITGVGVSGGGGDEVDAGTNGGGSGSGPGATPDAAVGNGFTCRNRVTTNLGSGRHNPGQDCNGACHNHGFTLAGTVFSSPTATTPFTGGTISIVDANSKAVDIVSMQNGNFYTSQTIAFPVTITASSCPDVAPMVTQVTQADAGCNKGGCHVAGAQGQIHLP